MDKKKVEEDENGYLRFIDSKKFVHIWAAEKKYGKETMRDKVVHHLDGDKKNNRHESLILLSKDDHYWLHQYLKDKMVVGKMVLAPWAKGFLIALLVINCILCILDFSAIWLLIIVLLTLVLFAGIKKQPRGKTV